MLERKNQLERTLKNHTNKGKNFKFTFDTQGELLMFCSPDPLNAYGPLLSKTQYQCDYLVTISLNNLIIILLKQM